MHQLTDNRYLIAWFIRQGLENAFRQKDRKRITFNQELTKFTLKLPVFLYNAGITPSIISPGGIHIKQRRQIVDINIDDVGQFSYNMQTNKLDVPAVPDKQATAIPEIKAHWQQHKHLVKI